MTAEANTVKMFTTTWCGFCKGTKRYLDSKGVAYEEIDIEVHPEYGEKIEQETGGFRTVPTLEINGHELAESVAILEYLDETIPAPALYPRDAIGRARVRQLVELVNSGSVTFRWVRGHSGDPMNELVDTLAVAAARSAVR